MTSNAHLNVQLPEKLHTQMARTNHFEPAIVYPVPATTSTFRRLKLFFLVPVPIHDTHNSRQTSVIGIGCLIAS